MDKATLRDMRIGILLTGDYGWAGGLYYSLNIIKLLREAAAAGQKLRVVVIVNQATPPELIDEVKDGHVEIVNLDHKSVFYKAYCKIAGKITKSNVRFISDINALRLDVLYPLISYEESHQKLNCQPYYWIYDFQHKFLPALFTAAEISKRDTTFQQIAEKAEHIVLSSEDAKKHFYEFYPQTKASVSVYKFISLIRKVPVEKKLPADIPANYYIVCNQFWPHKNHLVVLKAMALLLARQEPVHVVFTGKYDDGRNKTYVDELQKFMAENGLPSFVTLTGFISREEQTLLMQHAKAIIQPSFFEGWSTVIEDAKALNKFLIVSDISINREQVSESVLFFTPSDESALATHLSDLYRKETVKRSGDYASNIDTSRNQLLKLLCR
jgi:glycosyltransferase involved in cell wall biosynthesis